MLDTARIAAIRSNLHRIECHSWTTVTFQNQLLSFVELNSARGDFVIEVGCARGGMTSQLAYLTSELGKALYVVDVDQSMLDHAARAVKESIGSIPGSTHFVQANLKTFLSKPRISDQCILTFIDGDHRYDGVRKDIRALQESHLARPLSIAFHDFALRYDLRGLKNVRVDEAVRDALENETLLPMGELSGLSPLTTEPTSATHHAYYYKGGSEGALVTLAPKYLRKDTAGDSRKSLGSLLARLGKRLSGQERSASIKSR